MPVIPFVLATLFVLWVSVTGGEPLSVAIWALLAPAISFIVLCFSWKWLGWHSCRSRKAKWANATLGLLCALTLISVARTHWPVRLAYNLSRPAFAQVGRSLQAGHKYQHPMWVGLFWIEKAEIYDRNGKVCLWTDTNPAGGTAFTMCSPHDVPFNLWSSLELDNDWQLVSED